MAGKKKSKKSDKKSEEKDGEGGSKKEPQMTIREAILAYQISIKEGQMSEMMYEKKGLEEKNQRLDERRKELKEVQLQHIKTLLKQAKERDKELEDVTEVNKEQVEAALKEKWQFSKAQEQEIEDLKKEIEAKEREFEETKADVEKWLAYRDSGQQEHAMQIKLLQEELVDSQQNFEEMKGHLEKTLSLAKDEIKRSTDERLSDQKFVASEKAMTTLDKWTSQEVKDNDWLNKETELHRQEVGQLRKDVEQLERDNLEIMSKLFDCRIEDLKISRKFFLTQFQDNENLDETGVLEMDLSKLKVKKESELDYKPRRPQSATSKAVEDKVFSLNVAIQEEDEESWDESDDDPLDNYLSYEDEDFEQYLQLGPVELKLLQVVGESKPIHPPVKLTDEEEQAKLSAPDVWPITPNMLKDVTN